MPEYITYPIEHDADVMAESVFDYLQAVFPGWEPNDGNLETILIEAITQLAAEVGEVASGVTTDIFRYAGQSLFGLNPIDATRATAATTWTMINNSGYTIPAGTLVAIRLSGNEIIEYETLTDVIIPPGSTATAAGAVLIQAVEPGVEATGRGVAAGPVELQDPLDFVLSITQVAATTGGVDAEETEDYLTRLRGLLQIIAPRPILPSDYAVLARSIAGIDRALAIDGYNPLHNKLTKNQSDLEVDTVGWVAGINATIARVTTQQAEGSASLAVTSVAAGNMAAETTLATAPVAAPGEYWGAIASLRGEFARNAQIAIQFYTAADVFISQVTSVGAVLSTTAFSVFAINGTAPVTAAKARVQVIMLSAVGAGEDMFVDKISLRRAPGADWVVGGTPETGNERMIAVALVDVAGEAASSAKKAEVDALLQSRREVNFVVNIIDPIYNTIAVTATVRVLAGFDAVDVDTRVTTAITDYLKPANWARPSTSIPSLYDPFSWIIQEIVRRDELVTVANNVDGVNYVESLTLAIQGGALSTADVAIGGPAALTRAGTINVTANPA